MDSVATPPAIVPATPVDESEFYEIINGMRVEKPSVGYYECRIAALLFYYLEQFGQANQCGRAAVETLFRLHGEGQRDLRPDAAFVSFERWPRGRRFPRVNACPVVPDLAVEVLGPNNLAEAVLGKLEQYFRAGVRLVWVVYPMPGQVYVYDSPVNVRILGRADELDGGAVLPGFRLPVATLFEDEPEIEPPDFSDEQR